LNELMHKPNVLMKEPFGFLNHLEKAIDACFACIPRPRPAAKSISSSRLVAHRGAHDNNHLVQENTHAAFEAALALGCFGIEFDVHASADGVLVVNHDVTLKRLWGHDIDIQSHTFKELRAHAPALPSLAEVVTQYGKRMHLFIELKTPFNAVDTLIDALKNLTPCLDYHLLSLDDTLLPALNLFPKQALLLVPEHNNVNAFYNLTLKHQYGGILSHYALLSAQKIKQLKAVQQMVGVGFVNSKFSLYREINRGIPYLFTNNALAVSAYLKALHG